MLVGDVILSAREAVPDLPAVLNPPGSELVFSAVAVATGGFPAGTYYLVGTYMTPWGETIAGAETALTIPSTGGPYGINVNLTVSAQNTNTQSALSGVNVYLGNASGAENQQFNVSSILSTLQVTLTTATVSNYATPPFNNSAFLPDTGGSVASVSQVYRWFSDGLNRLASVNGGVPDMSGFGTQVGKANYTIPGDWNTLSDAWYDGYPLFMGQSNLVFRHNTINALSGMMSYTQVADTLVVELFAQPQRTAGVGSLSAAMTTTSAVAQTSGLSGWVLPFGMAMIGTPPTFEVVGYTMSGSVLQSLVRGLGGTNAQAWAIGTPVYELNCMFKGLRAAQLYSPGMAANTLRLPSTWVPLMHMYILARYRRIEQQEQEAGQLMQSFEAGMKEATKKKPAVGDRQIQPQDLVAMDVYPLLSRFFGGGLLPSIFIFFILRALHFVTISA